ncbi:hypothetical protein HYV50_03910 [Candidatus Pacearchaeota archaeon]|nr:hypothetical protein [Candidatus Pacearchaeota archaeon]
MDDENIISKKNFFVLASLILVFSVLFSLNFASAPGADCWQYTTNATCSGVSACKWKSDNWGSWCEELNCWSLTSQNACTTTSITGKNCTWQGGSTYNTCEQLSCWSFSGKGENACVNNSAGRSCSFSGSCYSLGGGGGVDCWNINSQATCQNTTGCAWGQCQDKGCWNYNASATCSAAKDPWNGKNCTWSSSGNYCTTSSCGDTILYPNQTACNNNKYCKWQSSGSSGYCQEIGCYSFDGNQTGCTDANTTHSLDCTWNNGYCNTASCWEFTTQATCTNKATCTWTNYTSGGWCEEVNCWTFDSIKGGNQSKCVNNQYSLACIWSGNPSGNLTNGWCYKDISTTTCANITTERNCYDTFYCWWQYNNINNVSAGGKCTEPNWTTIGGGVNGSITNDWNPGCYIFDLNSTHCNNLLGCNYTSSSAACDELGNNYGTNITTDGIKCTYINESSLCNDISVLSTCCTWQNGTCKENRATSSCWTDLDKTPNGEKSCEEATLKTSCEQLAGSPWYWPCKWDNSTTPAKCTVKTSDIWGNRTQNLITIENRQTCEAVGGRWVTENYCEGNVSVPTGRCEYKFDEERNCNKACFACEFKLDGTKHNTTADAKQACLDSTLGICEFEINSNAPNGLGFCNSKEQFKKGVAEECSATNCGGCSFKGDPKGANGTRTPKDYCNDYSTYCKWITDNRTITGGYCVDKETKTCRDACDRCATQAECANDGRADLTNTSGSCKWQGSGNDGSCVANIAGDVEICWNAVDDDNDALTDCADPGCYSDSFCGFVSGNCFSWTDNTTCINNKCEWFSDKWGSWCDFKGSQCWKYDGDQPSCLGATSVNETLNISVARLAGNNINESYTFGLANLEGGWVVGSVVIKNTSGTSLAGNFSVNYNSQTINFTNNTFMVSGGGAGNLTNVTYQYYKTTNQNCEWQNGTFSSGGGSGWCEQDWKIAETCMGKNQSACTVDCRWTNDTWCGGDGAGTDWCKTQGGWCDHKDFAPKNCWQYNTDKSGCEITSGCSWRIDQYSHAFCEINWSGNCWNYTSSNSCNSAAGNNCLWFNSSGGGNGWCGNKMDECWQVFSQSSCNSLSPKCSWDSFMNSCRPACSNQTLHDSQSACTSVTGCLWKADSGWCEETQMAACSNTTNYNNQTNCQTTTGCKWRNPGWCAPKDGFSSGGSGGGGSFGAECYKYDGNKTLCTDKNAINITCGWTDNFNPGCEVNWVKDCWQYTSVAGGCNATNGCWWNPNGQGFCMNLADQCWSNTTLVNNATLCNTNAYCNATTYGCEPTCFSQKTQSACSAAQDSICRWTTGWCNPAGMNEVFNGMETGQPTPLGFDSCPESGIKSSVDICGFGMKDMGNAYGFGAKVYDFTNASVCNKEKISGYTFLTPGAADIIGAGNETVNLIVYLDTDGSPKGGCALEINASATGYEFKFRYESTWNSNASKTTESFTSYICENSKWKLSDIKTSAWKKIMCSDIGGPMIGVEKGELTRFPTLYDSTKDIRVYVATVGNTGNVTTPSDTAGPGYATPGAIDFEIMSAFEFGADSAKFEDILRHGFTKFEDCFNTIDDDNDGNSDCNDWDCQYSPKCTAKGVNSAGYNDTSMPQVTGVKIEEYTDSALILYDTSKPTNGTLEFYGNDSRCNTLNTTIYDVGVLKNNTIRAHKFWHAGEIYNGANSLSYNLQNDTKYYYKLKVCDSGGKCATSKCSAFTTAPKSKCGFCNFVTRIKAPSGWTVSYDTNRDGTYTDHVQGQVCGPNSGLKTNYAVGRRVNIKLAKDDNTTYFEFINASLTKSALNDKVRDVDDSGDFISSGGVVGFTSETRDKIVNNLHPEECRIKITSSSCSSLFHCDDSGANCVDRTSEATLLNSTNCVWRLPYCEFSTYRTTTGGGGDTGPSGGGGTSGGGGGGIVNAPKTTIPSEETPTPAEQPQQPIPTTQEQPREKSNTEKIIFWSIMGLVIIAGIIGLLIGINRIRNREY